MNAPEIPATNVIRLMPAPPEHQHVVITIPAKLFNRISRVVAWQGVTFNEWFAYSAEIILDGEEAGHPHLKEGAQ